MPGGAAISVDIGGTFTDLVLLDVAGRCFSRKIPSTPTQPEQAVITGIGLLLGDAGLRAADIAEVLHGTTVGSNTLLQKAGARTGLLTTKGFRDVLEIGRLRTPDMFDLNWDKPQPLVRRQFRREIDERIDARGTVLKPLDPAEAVETARALIALGVQSIAICFINSYRNPEHELAAERAIIAAFPDLPVTTSVSVLPEQREYERTSTAVVNAYVQSVLAGYLRRLRLALRAIGITAPLSVANSNGGLAAAATAEAKPVFFISSGRSAGVMGAARLGESSGNADLIVFDMGGTTASASLVQNGIVSRTNEYEFRDGISTPSRFIKAGGYLMSVPTIDVAEVGNGAGSIAALDTGGLLTVGPVSAGAEPGPACYRRGGTQPTVTDANVALGLLPESLAGGALALDGAAAREAIERAIAQPLGIDVETAACGIRDIANANMTRAIRAVTVERGVDPRDFTLLAFGGNGPLHGCDLAAALEIPRVLFPRLPGVFTAMGMLASDIERYLIRPCAGRMGAFDPARASALTVELRAEALKTMAAEGFAPGDIVMELSLDLRFLGQESAIAVPLPDRLDGDAAARLREDFLARYRSLYHYASSDEVESTSIRLLARGIRRGKLDFAQLRLQMGQSATNAAKRRAHLGRAVGWREVPVMARDTIAGPMIGPALIESDDSTILIPAGVRVAPDAFGNLLAELPGRPAAKEQRSMAHA